jgi:hypothetical protein
MKSIGGFVWEMFQMKGEPTRRPAMGQCFFKAIFWCEYVKNTDCADLLSTKWNEEAL